MYYSMACTWVLTDKNAVLPRRSYVGSCGYDLALLESVKLKANAIKTIPLGIRASLKKDYFIEIHARSHLSRMGLEILPEIYGIARE